MNPPILSAHAAHAHALHIGFFVFCAFVVLFCVVAAKLTAPRAAVRD